MRHLHRLLAVLVGLLLVAGTATAVSTGATAAETAAKKEKREITINGKKPEENTFVIKGKISPGKGKIKAIVQTKVCGKDTNCKKKWSTYKRITTNTKGRYRQQVKAPTNGKRRAYYRVKTKPNKRYHGAKSAAIFIRVYYL